MSNANWQNHLNHAHQIYGNSAGNTPINHGNCLTNCGSAACAAPLGGLSVGGGLIGQQYVMPTYTITPPNPLSAEEQKELAALEEARKAETKALRIKEFKKLPAALRQHVVNHIMWMKTITVANTIEAPVSARETELKNRNSNYNFTSILQGFMQYHTYAGTPMDNTWYSVKGMIQGVSEEEIIDAHNEATIEEQLLGQETDVQPDKV